MSDALLDLLSGDVATRLRGVAHAPDTTTGRFALRAVLLRDSDANARAAAAERLGWMAHPVSAPWLREATSDRAPSVRASALAALARLGDRDAIKPVIALCEDDPVWSVRRAAVLALAVIAEVDAVAPLRGALEDPFWRVRAAAVACLAAIGDAHPEVRASLVDASDAQSAGAVSARAFLAERWGVAGPSTTLAPAPPTTRPDAAFWDPDPAVMTARLLDPVTKDPAAGVLVELLADPHETLRAVAVERLLASRETDALSRAMVWLEEHRVPHAAETVRALLRRAGDARVGVLMERSLDASAPRGAFTWAASTAARLSRVDLADRVAACVDDPDPRVRLAASRALRRLSPDARSRLVRALDDDDPRVRAFAVRALPGDRALEALTYAIQPATIRRALVAHAARTGDLRRLREGCGDTDGAARAAAIDALSRADLLDDDARRAALADEDPWVRAAACDAVHALDVLTHDADPAVRRVAASRLISHRRQLSEDVAAAAGAVMACDGDPWVRARAPALLDAARGDAALDALLALSRDTSLAVRAAASDAIERWPALREALRTRVGASRVCSAAVRAAAFTWLARVDEPDATDALVRDALATGGEPAEVREVLGALRAVASPFDSATAPARSTSIAPTPTHTIPEVARRPLGRTGILVSPLGVSGANDPPGSVFDDAHRSGVNLFFWEPRYASLTRFLRSARREEVVIAAGTYHADAPSIARDVDAALRRLRTDRLDVFLLFWARSPARLSAEVFDHLASLKRVGKVRAVGFSTHHRDLALASIEALPWDVVMTRHSAAHPGAERALLPRAAGRGVGVITFSALCYGRLLRATSAAPPPSAADCYRYSLSRPGVSACLSAPRSAREMAHNLSALTAPALDDASLASLRAHGERVYARSRRFNALVRQAKLEPASVSASTAALEELLASQGEARDDRARALPRLRRVEGRPR